MNEAEILDRLRRIATDPAARGLADDVAVVGDLVLTHDTIAEGVHFLSEDPPESVGWKLVAVNLSDLAGKGAEPVAALLSLTLVGDEEWELRFLTGVEAACESYGLPLVGGDTVALPPDSPRVLGLTAIGRRRRPNPTALGRNFRRFTMVDRGSGRFRGWARPARRRPEGRGRSGRHLSPPGPLYWMPVGGLHPSPMP